MDKLLEVMHCTPSPPTALHQLEQDIDSFRSSPVAATLTEGSPRSSTPFFRGPHRVAAHERSYITFRCPSDIKSPSRRVSYTPRPTARRRKIEQIPRPSRKSRSCKHAYYTNRAHSRERAQKETDRRDYDIRRHQRTRSRSSHTRRRQTPSTGYHCQGRSRFKRVWSTSRPNQHQARPQRHSLLQEHSRHHRKEKSPRASRKRRSTAKKRPRDRRPPPPLAPKQTTTSENMKNQCLQPIIVPQPIMQAPWTEKPRGNGQPPHGRFHSDSTSILASLIRKLDTLPLPKPLQAALIGPQPPLRPPPTPRRKL